MNELNLAELETLRKQVNDWDWWDDVEKLVDWLNTANGKPEVGDHEMAMRLLKLSEEVGEVAEAYIGWTGQNPRKGRSHTRADVCAELCDVIVSAAVALTTVAECKTAARGFLTSKLGLLLKRANENGGGS